MERKNKVSNQNPQGGNYAFERHRYTTCRKQHFGRCLAGMHVAWGVVVGDIR